MIEILSGPWPWYVAGPLIGLTVPVLLILGNKTFGISSSLRHICAACLPANIPFFKYNWKNELWNLFFVLGIFIGGLISFLFLKNPNPIQLNPQLINELNQFGIHDFNSLIPMDLFSFNNLLSLKGFFLMVVGGFMVGFGTRYAGGCTSGHSIMGLSSLQLSSLIATICFMLGGIIAANFLLPLLLKL
jgi:uncharacterized membrane protein YedE/YeeE